MSIAYKRYCAYHVDHAGMTVGHVYFDAKDDQGACINAHILKRVGKWPNVEVWANAREIECLIDDTEASAAWAPLRSL